MIGKVVSVGTEKTVVVLVERTKTHPLYKKSFLRTKRYQVHDELGVKKGDVVSVLKIRPISKKKHWKIEKVLGKDFELIAKEGLDAVTEAAIAEVMPEAEVIANSKQLAVEEKSVEKPKVKRVKKEKK